MGKLDRKIGLVTGGNSGIGLATATLLTLFVKEGVYVFITGRRELWCDPALRGRVVLRGSFPPFSAVVALYNWRVAGRRKGG